MKPTNSLGKTILPLFFVFAIVTCVAILLKQQLEKLQVDTDVVITANCILFFVSTISIALHKKASEKENPNAIVRSMMLASLIKLMVVAFSVVIYVSIVGAKRNTYGIFCGMGLYLIYTFLEVTIASKLKNSHGKN
jgi:uncharacterized membrane protein